MPAATKSQPAGRIEPTQMYTYAEIASFAHVRPRQVRRWADELQVLGYVQLPQGRRVLGSQYLDFIGGNTVTPEG